MKMSKTKSLNLMILMMAIHFGVNPQSNAEIRSTKEHETLTPVAEHHSIADAIAGGENCRQVILIRRREAEITKMTEKCQDLQKELAEIKETQRGLINWTIPLSAASFASIYLFKKAPEMRAVFTELATKSAADVALYAKLKKSELLFSTASGLARFTIVGTDVGWGIRLSLSFIQKSEILAELAAAEANLRGANAQLETLIEKFLPSCPQN